MFTLLLRNVKNAGAKGSTFETGRELRLRFSLARGYATKWWSYLDEKARFRGLGME